MPALGDEFRSAREARGLTLSDVAEQIHIRSVYLSAIETEDWPAIGAPVYVRGFIRTYARFLALDGESAVQRFNETVPADKSPAAGAAAVTSFERERTGPSLWAILGTLVAVVLVAFVGYEWWQFSQGGGSRSAAVATATAAPAAPAAQPSAAAGGSPSGAPAPASSGSPGPGATPTHAAAHSLGLRLTQRSWLRVVVDGRNVAEGLYPAGTSRTFTGSVVDLRAGNAGGVDVSVNGSPPKALGAAGDVVEQRYTL